MRAQHGQRYHLVKEPSMGSGGIFQFFVPPRTTGPDTGRTGRYYSRTILFDLLEIKAIYLDKI